MKSLHTLALLACMGLSACITETLTCEDARPASVRLTGYTNKELGNVVLKRYLPNDRFDTLIDSFTSTLYTGGGDNEVAIMRGFVQDTFDFELIIPDAPTSYRVSKITMEAPHTETITHGINKKEYSCENEWQTFSLNGEIKPFAEGYYIDIVR